MRLTSEAELAAQWDLTCEKAAQLRQTQKWPHVRLTRFDVRYTDEQIAQIVRDHSVSVPAKSSTGLTARSARRAS